MNLSEIIFSVIGLLCSFAAAMFGFGYYKQGRNQEKIDNNTLYKDRIDALEFTVKSQASDIERLTKEVQDFHQAINARDKKFAEAILNLQGKDPQTAEFIALMKTYIESNSPLLDTIKIKVIPTVERLDKFLDKQII